MKKINLLLTILILITSCNKINLNEYNFFNKKQEKELISQIDFENQLSLKYLTYSNLLYQKKLNKDARFFKQKSNNVYNKSDNKLLEISFNSKLLFSENVKFELLDYKNRLITLTQKNDLKEIYPLRISELFFTFNCWNYYTFVTPHINQAVYCKKEFIDLFLKLEREFTENKMIFYKQDNQELIQLTKEEKQKLNQFNNKNITSIYFDLNRYKLNAKALEDLKLFLKYLSTIDESYMIIIRGNTDRSGSVFYNNDLSIKRSSTIKNILVKNGVPEKFIKIENKSSKYPAVITNNKKVNDLNRRVDIEIQKNFDVKQDLLPQPFK